MKSSRLLDRRLGFSLASLGMLLGTIAPAVVPAFASAGTMSGRSIAMSSSAAGLGGVKYTIKFTPTDDFQNLVIDWCGNSPVIGTTSCTTPSGFDASSATLTSTSVLGTTALDSGNSNANHTEITGTTDSGTSEVTFELNGIHNPTNAGAFYARIYTYGATQDYTDTDTLGTTIDTGGVALSATDTIGVSAAVRETMTFCVSGADIWSGCTDADATLNPPSLTLGEGTPKALASSAVSTGSDYAQISTNAANGAVVYLKNSNSCGGLKRAEATGCDIAPATGGGSDFTQGNALFGVKLGSPYTATTDGTTPDSTASGTLTTNAGYAHYNMLTSGTTSDTSGNSLGNDVTSAYGGYLFGTNQAPIASKNVQLTFGASIGNTTPAGLYTANISLVATGSY